MYTLAAKNTKSSTDEPSACSATNSAHVSEPQASSAESHQKSGRPLVSSIAANDSKPSTITYHRCRQALRRPFEPGPSWPGPGTGLGLPGAYEGVAVKEGYEAACFASLDVV